MDLKDLIIARTYMDLETLIIRSFPYVRAKERINECIDRIRDYEEDYIPVLDDRDKLLGVITAQDIVEVVDDELGDDYAKLAGMTEEAELEERLVERMAGKGGTQSLAVTIRLLMDENLETRQKLGMIFKEMRIGFSNGLILGMMSFAIIGGYLCFLKDKSPQYAFAISGCAGIALLMAMTISSLVGTIVPIFFNKIHVDPAVASGPLITTVNDLVGVVTYYGVAWILLIQVLQLGY